MLTHKKKRTRWGIDSNISSLELRDIFKPNYESMSKSSNLFNITTPFTFSFFLKRETQEERQIRRLYVGNIPREISSIEIINYINEEYNTRCIPSHATIARNPVLNVLINIEKKIAFIDCNTPEQATVIKIYIDGIMFKNQVMRIRRPKDYIAPSGDQSLVRFQRQTKNSSLNTYIIPLHTIEAVVADVPGKLFIGNIDRKLRHNELIECLWGIGKVKSFKLKIQNQSELNAGYGFVEFKEPEATEMA